MVLLVCEAVSLFYQLLLLFTFGFSLSLNVQGKVPKISDCFMENVYCALEQVQMPTSKKDIAKFFSGEPPMPQQPGEREEEEKEEEEEEEGGQERGEEEGGRGGLGPPKAKRSKREVKALTVTNLHVSMHLGRHVSLPNVNDSIKCTVGLSYLLQQHRKQFSNAWLAFLRLPVSGRFGEFPLPVASSPTSSRCSRFSKAGGGNRLRSHSNVVM